ncbi:MAG: extracellular solute-binding protein [Bradyrhizobium sp.]
MKKLRSAVAGSAALASAIVSGIPVSHADELTLYATREASLLEPALAAFTRSSGITVRLVFIQDSLVKRLTSEGDASPADVLMTIGLDKTSQLVNRRLTQVFASPQIEQAVPAHLRGADSQWLALSVRPRIVMARKDSPLGTINYEDLADPRWRGKLCIRSALHQNNVALVAAYLAHHGEQQTETWLNGLKANLAHRPDGKDNDVIREISEGTCEIGIGNTVALAQLRDGREGDEWRGWARAVKAIPTSFKDGGSHVNLTGAAIARHAPHPAAALKFLEFLVTPAAQKLFAATELEYPVLATAEPDPTVREIGWFPDDTLAVDRIAADQQAAITLIRKVGFDE